jgi:hypothetical protein
VSNIASSAQILYASQQYVSGRPPSIEPVMGARSARRAVRVSAARREHRRVPSQFTKQPAVRGAGY